MRAYTIVRWILMILLGLGLLWEILFMIGHITGGLTEPNAIGSLIAVAISIVITFVGFYGAFKQHRPSLLTYVTIKAISLLLAIIFAQYSLLSGLLLIGLVYWQAELLRRGYRD